MSSLKAAGDNVLLQTFANLGLRFRYKTLYMPYTGCTDERLLALLKKSDEIAFTELYNRYWKLLFSVASNKTGSLTDAEEIVQDVFTDLWKRRATVEIRLSIKSYLAAAIKFQVYSLLAKRQREQKALEFSVSQKVFTPEQELDFKNLQISLCENIASLPEKCQLIYLLKQEGLSNKEIAKSLDISIKTVEGQVTTALRRLRTGMDYLFLIFFK
jgi:RNA polymerase sigma-70 factor (ECF subfamily)